MKKTFWSVMVWIDERFHSFWDFIDPENKGTFLDKFFYGFCVWANDGFFNCEDEE